jgi:hypothetical protein
MFGCLRRSLTFANVASALSLFMVLSTGAAMALPNMNTVFSDDIVDGQVKTADLGNGAVTGAKVKDGSIGQADLAKSAWTYVDPPNFVAPCGPTQVARFCFAAGGVQWENYATEYTLTRYIKDATGWVHLEGLIRSTVTPATAQIFYLPAGYRPSARLVFSVDCRTLGNTGNPVSEGRIDVLPDGGVIWPYGVCDPEGYISLAGITFRAEK